MRSSLHHEPADTYRQIERPLSMKCRRPRSYHASIGLQLVQQFSLPPTELRNFFRILRPGELKLYPFSAAVRRMLLEMAPSGRCPSARYDMKEVPQPDLGSVTCRYVNLSHAELSHAEIGLYL